MKYSPRVSLRMILKSKKLSVKIYSVGSIFRNSPQRNINRTSSNQNSFFIRCLNGILDQFSQVYMEKAWSLLYSNTLALLDKEEV